ncbi:MAG: hypothetical protein HYR85_02420 [Planctomycetes bacterium]|nr:hypothetical protein [Planctomycetota bacterium]MBI3846876.1 hypothetical protein [Planctomycetota bacterium]
MITTAIVLLSAFAGIDADDVAVVPTLSRAVDRADAELASRLSATEAVRCREAALLPEEPDLPSTVLDAFRARLFARDFTVTTGSAPDGADLVVEIGLARDGDGGVLRLRCVRPPLAAIAVRFLGKEWVDRSDSNQRRRGEDPCYVGQSDIEGAAADAEAGALAAALASVRREAAIRADADPIADAGVIERVVRSPIIRGKFMRDTFLETETKPYGAVYRGHVLLAVPENEIDKLARAIRELMRRDRWTWVLRGGLISAVAVIVFGGFVAIDGWLRGTHSRALKVACAMVFLASSIALLGVRL